MPGAPAYCKRSQAVLKAQPAAKPYYKGAQAVGHHAYRTSILSKRSSKNPCASCWTVTSIALPSRSFTVRRKGRGSTAWKKNWPDGKDQKVRVRFDYVLLDVIRFGSTRMHSSGTLRYRYSALIFSTPPCSIQLYYISPDVLLYYIQLDLNTSVRFVSFHSDSTRFQSVTHTVNTHAGMIILPHKTGRHTHFDFEF